MTRRRRYAVEGPTLFQGIPTDDGRQITRTVAPDWPLRVLDPSGLDPDRHYPLLGMATVERRANGTLWVRAVLTLNRAQARAVRRGDVYLGCDIRTIGDCTVIGSDGDLVLHIPDGEPHVILLHPMDRAPWSDLMRPTIRKATSVS